MLFPFFRPTHFNNLPQATDNSFIKKLQSSGRSLIVFYGSQTGTGEEFASRIAKEGTKYGMKGMVADPEECDMVSIIFYSPFHLRNTLLQRVQPAIYDFNQSHEEYKGDNKLNDFISISPINKICLF